MCLGAVAMGDEVVEGMFLERLWVAKCLRLAKIGDVVAVVGVWLGLFVFFVVVSVGAEDFFGECLSGCEGSVESPD